MTLQGVSLSDTGEAPQRYELGDKVVMTRYPMTAYVCNLPGVVTKVEHPIYEVQLDSMGGNSIIQKIVRVRNTQLRKEEQTNA